MASDSELSKEILSTLESLRAEIAQLNDRVAALESHQPAKVVDEEMILTISAAVAAYLGVKPKIRQIRLMSNPQWSHQGRATIQASHDLASRSPH